MSKIKLNPGKLIVTKNGIKGKIYASDEIKNNKLKVYTDNGNFLCDRKSIRILGQFDDDLDVQINKRIIIIEYKTMKNGELEYHFNDSFHQQPLYFNSENIISGISTNEKFMRLDCKKLCEKYFNNLKNYYPNIKSVNDFKLIYRDFYANIKFTRKEFKNHLSKITINYNYNYNKSNIVVTYFSDYKFTDSNEIRRFINPKIDPTQIIDYQLFIENDFENNCNIDSFLHLNSKQK